MGQNIVQKIIKNHLVSGNMTPRQEIAIEIDQTLTQDSTGTMAYLQFEAMGVPRVKTKKSVAYIDHNTLQTGLKMLMTINIFKQWHQNTVFIFLVRGTESVIKFI
jgi:aconitate hydratase